MAKLYFYYAATVASGAQTEIGGNDRYIGLCRKHFFERLREGEARQLSLGLRGRRLDARTRAPQAQHMNGNPVYEIAVWLVPLVIAIVFHEVAHGLVARRLGDPTAERAGRLTFNPLKHIDPFGTVILPLLLALSHAPVFGWAKPVPVAYRNLRHPRRDMVLVALAGPGMNLLLALVGTVIRAATLSYSGDAQSPAVTFVAANALNFILINIFLGVFNLIPVPPFDGGHIVEGLLPPSLAQGFRQIGRFSLLVFMVLLLVLPAISPNLNLVGRVVSPVVDHIATGLLGLFGIQL